MGFECQAISDKGKPVEWRYVGVGARQIPSLHAVLEKGPLMVESSSHVRLNISAEGARKGLHIRVLEKSAENREPSYTQRVRGRERVIWVSNDCLWVRLQVVA